MTEPTINEQDILGGYAPVRDQPPQAPPCNALALFRGWCRCGLDFVWEVVTGDPTELLNVDAEHYQ